MGDLVSIKDFHEGDRTLRGDPIFVAARRRVVILIHGSNTLGDWQRRWNERLKNGSEGIVVRRIAFRPTQLWKVVLHPYWTARRTREVGEQVLRSIDELAADDQISIVAHSYGTHLLVRWLRAARGTKFKNNVLLGSIVHTKRFPALSARADNIYNIAATGDHVVCAAEAYGLGLYEATGAFGVRQSVRNVTDYFVHGDHATIVQEDFLDEVVLPIVLGRPPPPQEDVPFPFDHQYIWDLRKHLWKTLFSVLLRPAAKSAGGPAQPTPTEPKPTNVPTKLPSAPEQPGRVDPPAPPT